MNTKWWKTAFAVLLALCLAVGISACTQNKDDTPENYTVTFTGEGVTFDGAAVAEEGEDYTFRLTTQAGYEAGAEFAVAATVGGETAQVAENDGTYTISAVSGDVAVTVTGMVRVYNVTFTGEGVTSSGAATARGG